MLIRLEKFVKKSLWDKYIFGTYLSVAHYSEILHYQEDAVYFFFNSTQAVANSHKEMIDEY